MSIYPRPVQQSAALYISYPRPLEWILYRRIYNVWWHNDIIFSATFFFFGEQCLNVCLGIIEGAGFCPPPPNSWPDIFPWASPTEIDLVSGNQNLDISLNDSLYLYTGILPKQASLPLSAIIKNAYMYTWKVTVALTKVISPLIFHVQ